MAPDNDSTASSHAGQYLIRAKLLAEAIPATSVPTGSNPIETFDNLGDDRNININNNEFRNGWPAERTDDLWNHSDLKNVSYVYIKPFFDELVEIGELN